MWPEISSIFFSTLRIGVKFGLIFCVRKGAKTRRVYVYNPASDRTGVKKSFLRFFDRRREHGPSEVEDAARPFFLKILTVFSKRTILET